MTDSLKEMYASTPLFAANATAVEALYEQYLQDPNSVPAGWLDYFTDLGAADTEIAHSQIRQGLLELPEWAEIGLQAKPQLESFDHEVWLTEFQGERTQTRQSKVRDCGASFERVDAPRQGEIFSRRGGSGGRLL